MNTYLLAYFLTFLLTYLLHGAESFLRSQPVLSYSRNSSHFMEPEGSLPQSQVHATCPYPVTDPVHALTSHFLKILLNIILLNIILPSMPGSSKWSFSLRFPHQNTVYNSALPHTCYMPISFSIWSPEQCGVCGLCTTETMPVVYECLWLFSV